MKTINEIPIIGITGYKNSGKTTLMEKLIRELKKRHYKIATIKHAHHNFDIDHENRDSYKHRKAGADQVLITSKKRWALICEMDREQELSLKDAVKKINPCDLILVEGFKNSAYPKIKIYGGNSPKTQSKGENDPNIIAHIYPDKYPPDKQKNHTIPQFQRNNIQHIADFISTYIKMEQQK